MNYYVDINGDTKGPYTIQQLRSMWSAGAVTGQTLYCQEGMTEWIPLSFIQDELEPRPASRISPASPPLMHTPASARQSKTSGVGRVLGFGCLGIIGLFVLFAIVGALSDSDRKTTESGHTEGVVYRVTTRIVAKNLKAPSTAKFPSFYDDGAVTFTSLGGNRYTISSYVDSQNNFGAMLRTHWTATVSVSGETVRLEDLQTR